MHFYLESDDELIAHASVIPRSLESKGRFYETGYVEAVCTHPVQQEKGHGSTVMRAAAAHISEHYELGALATGENEFYERLGWETWQGPTGVREMGGIAATPNEDGAIMILRTPSTGEIDLSSELTCEWRPGDVW
jgi:aminoglycoside 2'-N-acetyltransferase I